MALNMIQAGVRKSIRQPIAPRNSIQAGITRALNPVNQTTGLSYSIQKAPGGVYHTYADGRRVFVASRPPATPAAPAAAAAPTESAASQESVDPRDAQYYADSAQDIYDRSQKMNELAGEEESDEINYREALRRFREQQPRQQRNALINANRMGLSQSTYLAENQADIATQNARQESDMTGAREGRSAARRAARLALEQGATVAEAARIAAAADRQIGRYEQAADENALARNPSPNAPPARALTQKPKARPKNFKTVVKGGKVYRYYPGRKPVYVRPASRG